MHSVPDAIVLCGGAGTRLRSITGETPKVMASVAGRPFLELLLHQLSRHGAGHLIMAVGFGKEVIRSHFGDEAFGVRLTYSEEHEPLGTGGALRKAAERMESDIAIALNGDSYTDVDLNQFVEAHRGFGADVSMAVVRTEGRVDAGSVYAEEDGKLVGFAEKRDNHAAPYINAGIYLFSKSLLLAIPPGGPVSLESELLPRWLEDGRAMRVFVTEGPCVDIGTPARFREAQRVLENAERGVAELSRRARISM